VKFGAVMRATRERAGFNQEELAARMNLSQSDISKFENDRKIPDIATMMVWAEQTCAKEVMIAFLYGMDGITILQSLVHMMGAYITLFS